MDLLLKWRNEIAQGAVRLLFLDECHLVWGDICGYVWGTRNTPVEVPITSQRQRQTYYGAFDYYSKRFSVQAYESGNSDYTIAFLESLRQEHQQARLFLIWDGAPYHRSKQLREYLAMVNQGLPPDSWHITCIQLAPYAPEQNPVEDIWLQAKQFLRKFYLLCKSFNVVKYLFEFVTQQQTFTFAKAFMYDSCSSPI
jgi:transposase